MWGAMSLYAVVLVACAVLVHGIEFTGEVTTTNVVYNTERNAPSIQQTRTLSFRCTEADFGAPVTRDITKPDGQVARVNFTCGKPRFPYTLTEVARIPKAGTLHEVDLILSQDPYGVAVPSSVQAQGDEHGRGRWHVMSAEAGRPSRARGGSVTRLRQSRKAHGHHAELHDYDDDDGEDDEDDARSVRVQFGLGDVAPVAGYAVGGPAGAAGACMIVGCDDGGCDNCVTQAEFDTALAGLTAEQDRFEKALQGFTDSIDNLTAAQQELANDFNTVDGLIEEIVTKQLEALNASLNIDERVTDAVERAANATDEKLRLIGVEMDATRDSISNITGIVIDITSELGNATDQLRDWTEAGFTSIVTSIDEVRNVTQEQRNAQLRFNQRITMVATRLTTILRQLQFELQNRRAIAGAAQVLLAAVPSGETAFLFDVGTAPDRIQAADGTIVIDQVKMRMVDGASDGHQWTFDFVCATNFLVDGGIDVSTVEWFVDNIGPLSCDTDDAATCKCWIKATHESCDFNTDPTGLSGRLSAFYSTVGQLRPNEGGCTAGIKAVVTEDILSGTRFIEYVSNPGGRQVCRSPRTLAPNGVQVTSVRLGRSVLAGYDPGLCESFSQTRAMSPPAGAPLNFFSVSLNFVLYSYRAVWSSIEQKRDEVYGVLPSGMTTTVNPYARIDGRNVRRVRAAFMSYSDEHLPLYLLKRDTTEVLVEVSVECCSSNNFADVEYYNTTDVLIGQDNEDALPSTGHFVVGSLTSTNSIYAVPQSSISVADAASARAGSISYAAWATAADYGDRSEWEARQGHVFDAYDGASTAELFRTSLVQGAGSSFACVPGRSAAAAETCAILDAFRVTGNSEVLYFTPYAGTYEASVPVPDGDISSAFYDVCPIAVPGVQTALGQSITLTLPGGSPGTASIKVKRAGHPSDNPECVEINIGSIIEVQPGTAREVFIPLCPGSDPGARMLVTIQRLGPDSNFITCPNMPLELSVDSVSYRTITGLADAGYVETVAVVASDRTAAATLELITEVIRLGAEAQVDMIRTLNSIGLQVPQADFDRASERIVDYQRLLADGGAALQNRNTNFTGVTAAIREDLDDIRDLINSSNSRLDNITAQLQELADARVNVSIALNNTAALVLALHNASDVLNQAQRDLNNATRNVFDLVGRGLIALAEAQESDSFLGISGISVGDVTRGIAGGLAGVIGDTPDLLEAVAGGIVGLAGDGLSEFTDFVREIVEEVTDATGGILGSFGDWITIFLIVALVGLGLYVFCYLKRMMPSQRSGGDGNGNYSGMNPRGRGRGDGGYDPRDYPNRPPDVGEVDGPRMN